VKTSAGFAAAAAAIVFDGAVGWGTAGAAPGDELMEIGAPVAATGPTARESVLTKQGYDLWAETVNTRGGIKAGGKAYKVQIVYYDDQSKPQTSAELTERLISQDRVSFLLGPYGSPATFADEAIAEKHKMRIVITEGAADQLCQQGYEDSFGITSRASDYAAV